MGLRLGRQLTRRPYGIATVQTTGCRSTIAAPGEWPGIATGRGPPGRQPDSALITAWRAAPSSTVRVLLKMLTRGATFAATPGFSMLSASTGGMTILKSRCAVAPLLAVRAP